MVAGWTLHKRVQIRLQCSHAFRSHNSEMEATGKSALWLQQLVQGWQLYLFCECGPKSASRRARPNSRPEVRNGRGSQEFAPDGLLWNLAGPSARRFAAPAARYWHTRHLRPRLEKSLNHFSPSPT